jgi:arylsulfatase A-like enzyme
MPSALAAGDLVSPIPTLRDLALLVVMFYASAVLLEYVVTAIRRAIRGLEVGFPYLWMMPITEAALFAVIAIGLLIIAPVWLRRRWSLAFLVFVLAGAMALAAVIVLNKLTWWANVLVAVGVATRLAQTAYSAPGSFLRRARRVAITASSLVAVIALGSVVGRAALERFRLAMLPPAPDGSPNVLLLVLDTARPASMGLYSDIYGVAPKLPTTPSLERFAQRGVIFDRALATSSWTHPSHAGMFTGKYLSELRVGWRAPLTSDELTLAEVLRDHGYATGAFVANMVHTISSRGFAQGFIRYEDFVPSLGEFVLTSSVGSYMEPRIRRRYKYVEHLNRKHAEDINTHLLDWLDGRNPKKPFFAFLNFYDAHTPYLPPSPYKERFVRGPRWPFYEFGRNLIRWVNADSMPMPTVQAEQSAYEGAIAYTDAQLGKLFSELERRGELRNTIVIVTADHGEEFREHGLLTHGYDLYYPLVNVPFVMVGPGVPAGIRVPKPVTMRDLPSTILDLVGIKSPLPGRSLAHFWRAADTTSATWGFVPPSPVLIELRKGRGMPPHAPSFKGHMQSLVVDDRYQFIRNGDGVAEVYDIVVDPWEKMNLANTPIGQAIIARYSNTLPDLRRLDPGARDTL